MRYRLDSFIHLVADRDAGLYANFVLVASDRRAVLPRKRGERPDHQPGTPRRYRGSVSGGWLQTRRMVAGAATSLSKTSARLNHAAATHRARFS
jgi:hypothetical protein